MAPKLKVNLDFIMKRPRSHRLGALALINIIIIGACYWFLIGPKMTEIDSLKIKLGDLQVKVKDSRTIASDIERYKNEKKALEDKLSTALAQLPNEKEIPDLIVSISDAVKESGLQINLFKPVKERRKGFYAEVPVNMVVEGRYESLFEFAQRVANLPRIVNIESITIKTTQGGTEPKLKSEFVVTTFRFIPG